MLRSTLKDDKQHTFGLVHESSKINLNSASLEMLQKLPGMSAELAASIIDWRDEDSDLTEGGAESEYYLLQPSAYESKKAALETVEEVMTERMWDAEVRVAGAIATIWTPYDFYIGSEFSHCGIDVATLMRRDGGWKIINLNWTRDVPPNCALHPDGPPSS